MTSAIIPFKMLKINYLYRSVNYCADDRRSDETASIADTVGQSHHTTGMIRRDINVI